MAKRFRRSACTRTTRDLIPHTYIETGPVHCGLCATSARHSLDPGQEAVRSCQAATGAENAQRLDRDRMPAECTLPPPQGGITPHSCFETGPIRYGLYAASARQPGQEAVRSCQAAKGAENAQRLDQRRRRTFSPALYRRSDCFTL